MSRRKTATFLDFQVPMFQNDAETEHISDVHACLAMCLRNDVVSSRHFLMPDSKAHAYTQQGYTETERIACMPNNEDSSCKSLNMQDLFTDQGKLCKVLLCRYMVDLLKPQLTKIIINTILQYCNIEIFISSQPVCDIQIV